MLRNNLLILSFMFSTASIAAIEIGTMTEKVLGIKCKKQVSELVNSWNVSKAPWRQRPLDNGVGLVRPTSKMSHWITYLKSDGFETLSLVSPERTVQVRFDGACKSAMRAFKTNGYAADQTSKGMFTDKELFDVLFVNPKGIILSVSPGMGHSYTAIERMIKISKEKNLPLTVIMDPTASADDLREGAKDKKMRLPEIKKNRALELTFRETNLHYPNFVIYRNGSIISPVIPGLMDEAGYASTLDKFLEK